MNTWNSSFVHSHYEKQALGFITNIDSEIRLQPPIIASKIRELVSELNASPSSPTTLKQAQDLAASAPASKFPYLKSTFGCVAQWLSELGKKEELEALLRYADEKLYGKWENGGYFYRRYDEQKGEDWTHMDPFSGNSGVAYGRLNVEGGQKKMWEEPWTGKLLESRPWVDGLELESGVDVLRGLWDEEEEVLVVTGRTWDGRTVESEVVARNLGAGEWAAFIDGVFLKQNHVLEKGGLDISVVFGGDEVDVVFKRQKTNGEL